jgi:tRNA-binding EMAP/Myf-like protein
VAGIADIVADAADLVGKEMLVLVNLEPRILRGEESNGMILAVNVGGKPVLLTPEEEVPPGSPVT